MTRYSRLAAVLTLVGVAACAKREPPSGGPPDIESPRVVGSVPDSGAARVPVGAALSVSFSEGMEPRSGADAVSLAPPVEIKQRRWRGRTLELIPASPLKPQQTYTLFVAPTARDRHGNNLAGGAAVVFSTADSFARGRLEGEIDARGFSAPGVYVWCYDARRAGPDSTARDFDAIGVVDRLDQFRVDGLAVPGRYRLWVFADLNQNRSFEPSTDVLAPADTVFELTPAQPVARGLRLRASNPHAPGRVRGAVLDSLGDSLGVVRVLAVSVTDTSQEVLGEVNREGAFDLQLAAGEWWLRAFRDLDKSRSWQPGKERASERLRVSVEPAADIVDVRLGIRPLSGGP